LVAKLSANIVSEVYCLTSSQLLAKVAIDMLPVLVPKCYAFSILSENTLKFYKADKTIFDVDRWKAGAVAMEE
jgi:hypothetical protein